MSNYGLVFKEKHSYRDFGLIMKSIDRSLLPAVKRRQVDIPFLDGKYDLQSEPVYENRMVTVSFSSAFSSPEELQAKKRRIASWLSGRGNLVFDDEKNKYYEAKVFDALSLDQGLKRMHIQVAFECGPYALDNIRMQVDHITGKSQSVQINIEGNIKTCGNIILANTGSNTITAFSLRRERVK